MNIPTQFVYSPNQSSRSGHEIKGIILHYTRGGDINGTINWFKNRDAKVSAHYVVSRSGKVYQMVKEERSAWHAGSSTTKPELNGLIGLNRYTIGIEICNWGTLFKATKDEEVKLLDGSVSERHAGKVYCAGKRWTMLYHGPEPHIHHTVNHAILKDKWWPGNEHMYLWEPYPLEQLDVVQALVADIVERYPHITVEWIARHQDIDPTRKLDTGPAFPYTSLIRQALKREAEMAASDEYELGHNDKELANKPEMEEMFEARQDVASKKKGWCW